MSSQSQDNEAKLSSQEQPTTHNSDSPSKSTASDQETTDISFAGDPNLISDLEQRFSSLKIHWYPGHIAKAEKQLFEKLKIVDFVIELRDARIPYTSSHETIINQLKKPMICVLNKADLADKTKLKEALKVIKNKKNLNGENFYEYILSLNSKQKLPREFNQTLEKLAAKVLEKFKLKGILRRPARVMIIGYPNIGKSTIINRIAQKKKAKVQNRPGVTMHQQWIDVKSKLEIKLLDTPGVIPAGLHSSNKAIKLALCNCVSQKTYDKLEIAKYSLYLISAAMPKALERFYNLDINLQEYFAQDHDKNIDPYLHVLELICKARVWYRKAKSSMLSPDIEKAAAKVLNDFQEANIGKISLE